MNKLKKTNPSYNLSYPSSSLPNNGSPRTSKTLAYATASAIDLRQEHQNTNQRGVDTAQSVSNPHSRIPGATKPFQDFFHQNDTFPNTIRPQTSVEQYWAARALKAEALLSAQDRHDNELRNVTSIQDDRRLKEIAELNQQYNEKHAVMERLVIILIGSIVSLVALIIYLAAHYTQETNSRRSRWSLPLHFTIPILSPFTSVVEHETSMFGTKMLSVMVITFACFAYFAFKHWLSRTSR
ncbi:hypothetical protein BDQ17DRAFT_1347843 [Cyathus striatus]|nr:hypothetical protein BDQ17DRAFT_1347843 [Cyathus striatus]